jgi:hypothetical protein
MSEPDKGVENRKGTMHDATKYLIMKQLRQVSFICCPIFAKKGKTARACKKPDAATNAFCVNKYLTDKPVMSDTTVCLNTVAKNRILKQQIKKLYGCK